ncbi:MAG TPA: class I SAM-dependent methyltransferase [Thermoanaerobaculia bacterium]|nr:class I SAM-dependent methyltransferase [Thermoanaerobaculia bacterium]
MEIHDVAPGLTLTSNGFWLAPDTPDISYPDDGNEFCLAVEERSFWFTHRNRAIVAAVRKYPPAGGPIFDVGAGNGYVTAALQAAGFPALAIEPNRTGAQNAVARGVEHVVCGGLPSDAFRYGTAGAIGLFDVLEHIEHDGHFLRMLRPYLKPRGRLYLTTPAYQWLWSANDEHSGHYRRYTLERLTAVVNDAGYRVHYATYIFWFLPPAVFLFRTLARKSGNAPRKASAQHAAGGSAMRRLLERLLTFEVQRIERGVGLPFGGSCLLVASAHD